MKIFQKLNHANFEVTLSGNFTFGDHQEFREILEKIEDQEIQSVSFHINDLEFVDSAALGMLLLALDVAEKHHKKIILVGAAGQVKKMFDLARFDTLFQMA